MVVATSQQTGSRPETIRTRLARFMPNRAAAGWSVSWSAEAPRPEDIGDEYQLRAADHLGCFGVALSHALARSNVAATRLAITAQASPSTEDSPKPIVVEVRAQIPGVPLDQNILETVLRHVESPCPSWRSIVEDLGVTVIGILEEPASAENAQADTAASARPSTGGSSWGARLMGAVRRRGR
jgi:hypothetical protein